MVSTPSQLAALPRIQRFTVIGATVGLVVGGLVGLVLGLFAYPATAWFAILEVGVPAGMCGAVLGALAGLLANGVQRTSSS